MTTIMNVQHALGSDADKFTVTETDAVISVKAKGYLPKADFNHAHGVLRENFNAEYVKGAGRWEILKPKAPEQSYVKPPLPFGMSQSSPPPTTPTVYDSRQPIAKQDIKQQATDRQESSSWTKLKLGELEVDADIYPRQELSHKTVESYVEALKAGAVFPPLEIQRIKDNGSTRTVVLDGKHRFAAYKEYNKIDGIKPILDIDAVAWKPEVLDKKANLNELRLQAAWANVSHGDRLSMDDRKFQARRIVSLDPKIENAILAGKFGVVEQTVSAWVSDIRASFYASRDSQIFRFSLLGWTQQEIGEIYGLTQQAIAKITTDFARTKTVVKSEFEQCKPIEEIAKFHKLDLPLLYAILLDGKDDLGRFETFGGEDKKPETFNVWYYSARDTRLGMEAKGNIPGQIILNLLYYYAKQGDLIVDPMVGGGSTIDACLVMGRRCRGYDITPNEQRKDIEPNDIAKKLPESLSKADLVFLDPPYYNMVFENLYKNIDEFYAFIKKLAKDLHDTVKKGCHVTILIADMTEKGRHCLSGECYRIFMDAGFAYMDHISAPMSPNIEAKTAEAKETRRLIGRNRDLYVFKKVS